MAEAEIREELFLRELVREEKMEWSWMKLNRAGNTVFSWLSWVTRMLLLAVSLVMLRAPDRSWFDVSSDVFVAIFSALNLVSPFISSQARFLQRLKVHDVNARGYDAIRIKLITRMISLEEAVQQYLEIRTESPEVMVSQTP
jgi:hypothetical protein